MGPNYGDKLIQNLYINSLYKLNILKFSDIVCLQSCLFMSQIEHNGKFAKNFPTLKQCGDNHCYNTRSVAQKLSDIPILNYRDLWYTIIQYGTQKPKKIKVWKNAPI